MPNQILHTILFLEPQRKTGTIKKKVRQQQLKKTKKIETWNLFEMNCFPWKGLPDKVLNRITPIVKHFYKFWATVSLPHLFFPYDFRYIFFFFWFWATSVQKKISKTLHKAGIERKIKQRKWLWPPRKIKEQCRWSRHFLCWWCANAKTFFAYISLFGSLSSVFLRKHENFKKLQGLQTMITWGHAVGQWSTQDLSVWKILIRNTE